MLAERIFGAFWKSFRKWVNIYWTTNNTVVKAKQNLKLNFKTFRIAKCEVFFEAELKVATFGSAVGMPSRALPRSINDLATISKMHPNVHNNHSEMKYIFDAFFWQNNVGRIERKWPSFLLRIRQQISRRNIKVDSRKNLFLGKLNKNFAKFSFSK